MSEHLNIQSEFCFECGKIKPENPKNPHDMVSMRWDWRLADRPRLEDPIPQTLMCHECFRNIRDEFSPRAPYWDLDGVKHDRNPEQTNMEKTA